MCTGIRFPSRCQVSDCRRPAYIQPSHLFHILLSLLLLSQKDPRSRLLMMSNALHLETSCLASQVLQRTHHVSPGSRTTAYALPRSCRRAQDTSPHTASAPLRVGQDQVWNSACSHPFPSHHPTMA